MIKQAFLHIGGEKTGTTTLQHFLTQNSGKLKRAGFYYPCEPTNICFEYNGHFPVAGCLTDGAVEFIGAARQQTLPGVMDALAKMCSASDAALILSCEHFSSRLSRLQQLQQLRSALQTDNIKIIFYAREPLGLALASWSTGISCGGRKKFNADNITPGHRYYNHLQTLDLWAEIFGRENMIVREYDRAQMVGGDIRSDFCRLLGVELKNPVLDDNQNQSLDAQRLEVLRSINDALPLYGESADGWRRAQHIRRLIADCVPEGAPLSALVTQSDAARVKARFEAVNRELNERYFGGQLSRKWFPGVPAEMAASVTNPGEQTDLVPILRDTIIRIAETTYEYEVQHRRNPWHRGKRRAMNMLRALQKLLPGASAPTTSSKRPE